MRCTCACVLHAALQDAGYTPEQLEAILAGLTGILMDPRISRKNDDESARYVVVASA